MVECKKRWITWNGKARESQIKEDLHKIEGGVERFLELQQYINWAKYIEWLGGVGGQEGEGRGNQGGILIYASLFSK